MNAHIEEIIYKTGIPNEKFKELREDLAICVEFIQAEEYKDFLKEASLLLPDYPDDIDFLVLAIKLELPIWSNDTHLKSQNKIKVYTTKELFDFFK
ncbi:hypothetical protein HYV50_02430 [Candidatus Pacearchaeota archaeon]|nr:hypothetical protein [Candidatus Pacearchaeota archaeon]